MMDRRRTGRSTFGARIAGSAATRALASGAVLMTAACSFLTHTDGLSGAQDAGGTSDDGATLADAETIRDGGLADSSVLLARDATPSSYVTEVMSDSPLAYWRLGEASGGTASDAVGNYPGVYLTDNGPVTFGVPGALAGDLDTSIVFDRVGAAVNVGDVAALAFGGTHAFTIELWARPTVAPVGKSLLAKMGQDGAGYQGYWLLLGDNGLEFRRYLDNQVVTASRPSGILKDVWSHVAVTYDGATMLLFVDGAAGPGVATTQALKDVGPFRIGNNGFNSPDWVGGLDEVAVYDHALSAARIARHHEAGVGQ